MNLAKIKNLRANIEQVLEQELKMLPEPVEMQDMKSSGSQAIAIPTLETNVDDVLPPLKEASVDYPLTQPDPAPQTVGDGRREVVPKGERSMSWKLASPINMPDIEWVRDIKVGTSVICSNVILIFGILDFLHLFGQNCSQCRPTLTCW